MNLNSIWADCKESYDLFNKVIYSVYLKMLEEKTIPQRFGGWGPFVTLFPDEAITFEKYQRIFPYDAEQAFHESFSVAMQEGYLKFDGDEYRATEKGEQANRMGMQALTDAVAPLQPMPQDELKRLVDYLIRLCAATNAAPEPPSHFCQSVYKNYKRTFSNDAACSSTITRNWISIVPTRTWRRGKSTMSRGIVGRRSLPSGMAKRTRSINSTKNIQIAASRARNTPKPVRNSSGADGWRRTRARIGSQPRGSVSERKPKP